MTAVSPAVLQPGQSITVVGTNLTREGFTAQLQYSKKYLASGESPTGLVDAASQSPTQLVFHAPSNMRPTGLGVRYRATSRTSFAISTVLDTSFLSRAPFAIPGNVTVVEPPVVSATNQGFAVGPNSTGQLVTMPMIVPGPIELSGRNFVSPAGVPTTVTLNGTAIQQSAPPRYDPSANGGKGGDFITLQVAEPNASAVGTLAVTAAGATGSNANTLIMRRPRVTGVDEINGSGAVVGPAAGRLVRGKRYQLRGTDFAAPATGPLVVNAAVKLGAVSAQNVVTVDATHAQFTIPTSLTASTVELLVVVGGVVNASAGQFSVSDAGAIPPPLADMIVSPSPTIAGAPVTVTVAFSGSIAAGTDVGSLVISSPTSAAFVGLPVTVPITSNPQVVTIPTRLSSGGSTTLRARLTRFTGAVDSLSRTLQFTRPTLTGLTLATSSVAGGSQTTAQAAFDFPAGVGGSCGSPPFSQPDLRIDVTVSDTSAVDVGNNMLGSSTGVCVQGNPTEIVLITRPVSSARSVQITAQLGQTTRTATLTVLPPALTLVKVDRPTLTSLQSAVGTVTMSAPLLNSAALLSSSDPAVSVPAKLMLGTGTSTNFAISTLPVASARTVTISAAVNGTTQSTTLTLNPLQFTSVSMSPSAAQAGSNAAGSIALNATINLPFTATLSSSDPSVATVPASVSFAASQSAAVFSVQTLGPQTQQKTVTITATYTVTLPTGGTVTTTKSGTLTVNP